MGVNWHPAPIGVLDIALASPTVLIMDDEPSARGALVRVLQLRGYEVIETDSLRAALSVLKDSAVDAAILDVRLSGEGSGLEVLKSLRQHLELEKIPVLVWTGALLSDAEEWSVARHRAHLFQKPEGMRSLANFLDQLLDRDNPQ